MRSAQFSTRHACWRETTKQGISDLKAVNAPSGFALLCRFAVQQRCDTRPLVFACETRYVQEACQCCETAHRHERMLAHMMSAPRRQMHFASSPPHHHHHHYQQHQSTLATIDVWSGTNHVLVYLRGGQMSATCNALLTEVHSSCFEKCVQPSELPSLQVLAAIHNQNLERNREQRKVLLYSPYFITAALRISSSVFFHTPPVRV